MHVAVGSIFIECNQFGGTPADLARFEQYELRRGTAMLDAGEGVVGGMLDVLRAGAVDIRGGHDCAGRLACPADYGEHGTLASHRNMYVRGPRGIVTRE